MLWVLPFLLVSPPSPPTDMIGNHPAVYSPEGLLRPWTSWHDAVTREMAWYRKCPDDGSYPRYISVTFMDGNYHRAKNRSNSIPAMQSATGILSYLRYDRYTQGKQPWVLERARNFADYVIQNASTPAGGDWPEFPRSTGKPGAFPQAEDCGSQADRPYEIEPDKGGLFAYALMELWQRTHEARYLERATAIARTLVRHMGPGSKTASPWPFRVDYRTGAGRGQVAANSAYPLALFDALEMAGLKEFGAPKRQLWQWIHDEQLPSADQSGSLWVAFFEDYDMEGNRNSWSATNLAKLLLRRREAIDPDWKKDARRLLDYVTVHFVSIRQGVPVCGEQDDDKDPWGGALSNYGGAMAMYARATGDPAYKSLARQALNYALYAVDEDGCPGQSALYRIRGGWQEDAHTDVLHNVFDAIEAFPEWDRARR